jgi:tetrahydromethanopterin S-methyltransferase subunit B
MQIRQMAISGANGSRTPMFSGGMADVFGAAQRGGTLLGQRKLSQSSGQDWFNMAVKQVQKFDDIVMRLRKVANKQVREQLAERFIGDPGDAESGMYRRNSVASNVAEAQQYTPVNTLVFDASRVQNRVEKLRDITHDFLAEVESAEASWGSLPDAQIIERVVEVEVPGQQTFPVVPVVLGGAGVIALLALLGVFGGK